MASILTLERYYDYDKTLEAEIPGIEHFKGRVVHPQFWPQDLDYNNKKVAVIGSGEWTVDSDTLISYSSFFCDSVFQAAN
jgi:hypothetical protein